MFLHSMRDCCRRSSPVSQSRTRPPISTVTTPLLSHSASRASVSEIADIHAVYGERDSALKEEPRVSQKPRRAERAGDAAVTCVMLPLPTNTHRPKRCVPSALESRIRASPVQGGFLSALTHLIAQEQPEVCAMKVDAHTQFGTGETAQRLAHLLCKHARVGVGG